MVPAPPCHLPSQDRARHGAQCPLWTLEPLEMLYREPSQGGTPAISHSPDLPSHDSRVRRSGVYTESLGPDHHLSLLYHAAVMGFIPCEEPVESCDPSLRIPRSQVIPHFVASIPPWQRRARGLRRPRESRDAVVGTLSQGTCSPLYTSDKQSMSQALFFRSPVGSFYE